MDSLGDIWKIIYLGFEKSQRSVTHDSLHYINILTYLSIKLREQLEDCAMATMCNVSIQQSKADNIR